MTELFDPNDLYVWGPDGEYLEIPLSVEAENTEEHHLRAGSTPDGRVAMTAPLGWLVVDGHKVPIVTVELRGGKVHFVGSADGPIPAASGWITVVGRDGQGICQGDEVITWEQVRRDETLSLVLPVSIDWLHTPAARPT